MKIRPAQSGHPSPPAVTEADHQSAAAAHDDMGQLTVFEAAVRKIYVRANGLQAYYRSFYAQRGKQGRVAGTRKDDDGDDAVWRHG